MKRPSIEERRAILEKEMRRLDCLGEVKSYLEQIIANLQNELYNREQQK